MKPLIWLRDPRVAPFRSALLFAAIGTGTIALGCALVWRALERDNEAFVQQSIGDTTSMLATQVTVEVDRLKRHILEVGEQRLDERMAIIADAIPIEGDPEIFAISLWHRPEAEKPAVRACVGINQKFDAKANGSVVEPVIESAIESAIESVRANAELDLPHVEKGFRGVAHVTSASIQGWSQPIARIVVPIGPLPADGKGEAAAVLSALVSLEKLQKFFAAQGFVQSGLIDASGIALTHSDPKRIGRREGEAGQPLAPLMEHLGKPSAGVESGIQALSAPDGTLFYGGFRRISSAGLAILSSVSADENATSLDEIRESIQTYLLLVFLFLAGASYWWFRHRAVEHGTASPDSASGDRGDEPSVRPPTEPLEPMVLPTPPRKLAVVAMHGSMRGFNQILDNGGAQEATDALNDFFAFSAYVVQSCGGHFECESGASFGATWEIPEGGSASSVMARAIACALLLRTELDRLNQGRKVDGKKALRYGVGLHVGQALWARLGVVPDLRESVTGEGPACARALDRVALAKGRDFVISQAALKCAHGVFAGEALGETRLTADTGLTECYAIQDFNEDASVTDARIEAPTSEPAGILSPGERLTGGETREVHLAGGAPDPSKVVRWLVNNGSQIVGPFAAEELSTMLFAQELDFDCECWHEETGKASRLESAGIFSGGSEDAGACFWVYDGKLVHGPVTEGFIRTAVQHGAFSPDAYVCENSTIAGWRRLSEMAAASAPAAAPDVTTRTPGTGSADEAA
jgi:class 3 adenylate cyclase